MLCAFKLISMNFVGDMGRDVSMHVQRHPHTQQLPYYGGVHGETNQVGKLAICFGYVVSYFITLSYMGTYILIGILPFYAGENVRSMPSVGHRQRHNPQAHRYVESGQGYCQLVREAPLSGGQFFDTRRTYMQNLGKLGIFGYSTITCVRKQC
jgi:hypothetical protein